MKTTSFALIIFAFLTGSAAACQPVVEPITVQEQDAGKTITLNAGDILRIELDGNIAADFNWIPTAQDPVLLNQLGEVDVVAAGDLMSAEFICPPSSSLNERA